MVIKTLKVVAVSSLFGAIYFVFKSIYNYSYAKDSDIIFQEFRPCSTCEHSSSINKLCAHRNRIKLLYDELEAATKTIDICMYLFTDQFIYNILLQKRKEGVQIRIITDAEMAFATKSCILPLYKAGVPTKYFKSVHAMHMKFCIIDNKVVCTGSFNWTKQATSGNYETLMILRPPRYVRKFIDAFEDRWVKFTPFENNLCVVKKPSIVEPAQICFD